MNSLSLVFSSLTVFQPKRLGVHLRCLSLPLSLMLGQAFAQESAVSSGNTGNLQQLSLDEIMSIKVATVTTASKKSEKTTEAPGTAMVIDQHDIRTRGYSNLSDVLRDLPGMELSESIFTELGSQVSVRGIPSSNKIVVLVNGMRVNPPGGEYFPLRSDFSVRNAEQIEVIYGPGSTLYGQDAISAVINVKTKNPPLDGKTMLEGGMEGGLHHERELWGSIGKVFDAERNIAFSGFVQYHNSDLSPVDREYPGWWSDFRKTAKSNGSGVVPDRLDYGLNAFAKLDVGDFSLQSWYRDSERSSAEGYGPPILGFLPEARWQDRSWVTQAKHVWTISDSMSLNSEVTYNWYEVDPHSRYIFPRDATHWFFNDFKYARGTSISVEETLHAKLSDSLSALAGVVYTNYDIIPKSTIPGGAVRGSDASILRQAGNFVYYTTPGDPASRHEIPRAVDVGFDRIGAYFEFDYVFSPQLKFIAGGRVDKDSRIDDPSYTPRAAVIWDVSDSFTTKYTYSQAYISPAPYFGFSTYDRGDILNTSNPLLQPETSKTHEVTFTYNHDPFDIGLSLYYGEQSNLITVSDVASQPNILLNPVFIDPAGTQSRILTNTVNSGSSTNMGLDFYGKARLSTSLTAWFSYSYTSFEQMNAGKTSGLQGISMNNYRLGTTWAVSDHWFITPSLVARSTPQNLVEGKLGSSLSNPWELNLHVLYRPTEKMEFYLGVRNLTNNHNASTGLAPFAIPQETISGVVGLQIKL
jgi:outer membrane receptor protein involved in Fe transport